LQSEVVFGDFVLDQQITPLSSALPAAHARSSSGGDRHLLLFGLILACIVGIFAYLHWTMFQETEDDAATQSGNLANVIVENVQDALRRSESNLRAVSHQLRPEDLTAEPSSQRRLEIERSLEDHLVGFPEVSRYAILNANGDALYLAGSGGHLTGLARHPWFETLKTDPKRPYVLSDAEEWGVRHRVLVLALPIRQGEELRGVILAALDLDHFQTHLDRLKLSPHAMIGLRRSDSSTLLLHRPQVPDQINSTSHGELFQRIRAGDRSGVLDVLSPMDNVRRLSVFQTLEGYPLYVTVATAPADYLDSWRNQTLILSLAVGVLLLMMSVLFLRQRRAKEVLTQANKALRRGEALLMESEERFRATFEQAAVGIIHNSFDHRLLRVNNRFCEIIGFDPMELQDRNYLDFTHPDDLGVSDHAVVPLLTGERQHVAWEKRYIRKDGQVVWVRLTAALQRDRMGQPLHFITTVEDVTRRKLAEERLSTDSARFQQLLRTASDGIHVLDEDGNLREASESFLRMLGYSQSEAAGLNIRQWEAMIPSNQTVARVRELMTEIPTMFESRHRRRDGTIFDVEISARKVVLQGKRYLYASARDVTARKQADAARSRAEIEVRATTARMRLVLETAAEGIVGMDDECRVVFANRAAAEMLGWDSPEIMQGKGVDEVLGLCRQDGSPCPVGESALAKTLEDGETRRVADDIFCGPNGIERPMEYVAAPLMVEGIPVGLVVAFHDISERRLMESELRRSNAELEQFAYVASHDLRQPLRMITSYLGLIERQLKDGMDADTRSFFDFAMGGAKRMDRLILDLLEYSRVGRSKTSLQPLPLTEVVEEALLNLTVAINEAGAQVATAEGLPTVMGDRLELVRLFQNIVGNAVKYRLADRPCRVQINWQLQGREWVLSVRDNGIGINPRDFERAFGVFQRLVQKDQYEGTGIGLAVCKKIVEHHGGRIWIESEPGESCTFLFTFPVI